jgi:diacylglycerol kinase family enzyme
VDCGHLLFWYFSHNSHLLITALSIQIFYASSDTTHRYHAKEIARDLNIRLYDAVVSVSGDGVLHEVINGLMERPDAIIAHKLPVGAIPGGKKVSEIEQHCGH